MVDFVKDIFTIRPAKGACQAFYTNVKKRCLSGKHCFLSNRTKTAYLKFIMTFIPNPVTTPSTRTDQKPPDASPQRHGMEIIDDIMGARRDTASTLSQIAARQSFSSAKLSGQFPNQSTDGARPSTQNRPDFFPRPVQEPLETEGAPKTPTH